MDNRNTAITSSDSIGTPLNPNSDSNQIINPLRGLGTTTSTQPPGAQTMVDRQSPITNLSETIVEVPTREATPGPSSKFSTKSTATTSKTAQRTWDQEPSLLIFATSSPGSKRRIKSIEKIIRKHPYNRGMSSSSLQLSYEEAHDIYFRCNLGTMLSNHLRYGILKSIANLADKARVWAEEDADESSDTDSDDEEEVGNGGKAKNKRRCKSKSKRRNQRRKIEPEMEDVVDGDDDDDDEEAPFFGAHQPRIIGFITHETQLTSSLQFGMPGRSDAVKMLPLFETRLKVLIERENRYRGIAAAFQALVLRNVLANHAARCEKEGLKMADAEVRRLERLAESAGGEGLEVRTWREVWIEHQRIGEIHQREGVKEPLEGFVRAKKDGPPRLTLSVIAQIALVLDMRVDIVNFYIREHCIRCENFKIYPNRLGMAIQKGHLDVAGLILYHDAVLLTRFSTLKVGINQSAEWEKFSAFLCSTFERRRLSNSAFEVPARHGVARNPAPRYHWRVTQGFVAQFRNYIFLGNRRRSMINLLKRNGFLDSSPYPKTPQAPASQLEKAALEEGIKTFKSLSFSGI